MVSITDDTENEDIGNNMQGRSKHDVWLGFEKASLGIWLVLDGWFRFQIPKLPT